MKRLFKSEHSCLPEAVHGRLLSEADPLLYEEVERLVLKGEMSAAACTLTLEESAVLATRLATCVVEKRCSCEDDNCYTYHIRHEGAASVTTHHTVRYFVNGELLIHFEGDGVISKVERLWDDPENVKVRYAVQGDGSWKQVRLESV